MPLPNSYTLKPSAIETYFDAILKADAPERFNHKFLQSLDFKSTNDRPFISILKELKFLDDDSVPTQRYYEFLDKSQSKKVLAKSIKEAYSDLFTVNKEANKLSAEEIKNKLRTLYSGSKKDGVIGRIASTFSALCNYADFSETASHQKKTESKHEKEDLKNSSINTKNESERKEPSPQKIALEALQYHINIILPENRDQIVYDAIFKSLRDHLG